MATKTKRLEIRAEEGFINELNRLADASGTTRAEVIDRAIGLYATALHEIEQGKTLRFVFPDRQSETFGTTSLITDYHPEKRDTLSLEDVIAQLKHLSCPTENEIRSTLEEQQLSHDDFLFDLGQRIGMKRCAELTLNLLEKLQ